jgi:hypothetical protein
VSRLKPGGQVSIYKAGRTDHYAARFSRDKARFADTLDVIKFLCKDLWTIVFRKQIDNLKTNHRVCLLRLLPRHCSS